MLADLLPHIILPLTDTRCINGRVGKRLTVNHTMMYALRSSAIFVNSPLRSYTDEMSVQPKKRNTNTAMDARARREQRNGLEKWRANYHNNL